MEDKILRMFFEPERWEYAIDKGVGKDIRRADLIRLTEPKVRVAMYAAIRDGKYQIAPPHTAQIPKENGEFRTVYINEPTDRIFLSIANDLLFDLMPEMIHDTCKAYRKGIGCGMVVQEISKVIVKSNSNVVGFKSDLSKYFDTVPRKFIHAAFDKVEDTHGKSAVIDVLRKYYDSDIYFDTDGNIQESYQSLKQGCSVASWLADVVLFDIDAKLASMGNYRRYSDDMLYLGENYEEAMKVLESELAKMDMKLNPKKVENVYKDRWVKFLGFAIKGNQISLHKSRIKAFQKAIESATFKIRGISLEDAVANVNRALFKGNGQYSWATQVLSVINVEHDINEMNKFAIDGLRSVVTGKHKLGGLGFVCDQEVGCISRGVGQNVRANREKTPEKIEGFLSLDCMRNALITNKAVYRTLVRNL